MNTDLATVAYMSNNPLLMKSAGKVQKKVIAHKKDGSSYQTTVWVNPDEVQAEDKPKQEEPKQVEKPVSRDWTKEKGQCVPLSELSIIPDHFKQHIQNLDKTTYKDIMVNLDPNSDLHGYAKNQKGIEKLFKNPEYKAQEDAENKRRKFKRVGNLVSNYGELTESINRIENSEIRDCLTLIRITGLRPSSTKDTKADVQAYGATTLKGEHLKIEGDKLFLDFIGKEGIHQRHEVTEPKLLSMLLERKKNTKDDEDVFNCNSTEIRAAMACIPVGGYVGFMPKDLRTTKANIEALAFLQGMEKCTTIKQYNAMRSACGDHVSGMLGNTRIMALNSYIDPAVFQPLITPELQEKLDAKKAKAEEKRLAKKKAKELEQGGN